MSTEHREDDIGAVARRDDRDTVGESLQDVLCRHPGDQNIEHLTVQERRVALHDRALDRGLQLGNRRRHQQRLLRQHIAALSDLLQRLPNLGELGRITPGGHHRRGVGVLSGDLVDAHLDDLGNLLRSASLAFDGEHHRRAEVGRDAGVDRQLAGRGHVGVVAADHEHGIAPIRDPVIPVDDLAEGSFGVVVQLVIRDPDAVVVGQAGCGVVEQKLQDVVPALGVAARNGAEHPDAGDGRREPVQDPQRDRRLSGVTFRRCDVDGGDGRVGSIRHGTSLRAGASWR